MKHFLLSLILVSPTVSALEYGGHYTTKVKPKNCAFGSICHESEYKEKLVILERRVITFDSYTTKGYDVYANFTDKTVKKRFEQKACPSIIKHVGQSYKVAYDPHFKSYKLDCKNFK